MATTLKLVRLSEMGADIDSLDLTASGITLAKNGYNPTAAADSDPSVYETITLAISGSSADAVATALQNIDTKIRQAGWYNSDPVVEPYSIWIRSKLNSETSERQAMILKVSPPKDIPLSDHTFFKNHLIGTYTFGIERTPYWEDVYTYPTTASLSGIGNIGGSARLSETIGGDVPARLAKVALEPGTGHLHGDYFIGFKTDRFGSASNFVPVWSLKDGHFYPGDTTTAASAAAYSGTAVTCDFSGIATLRRRVGMLISYVTANDTDQRGSYSVLMRATVSDNVTVCRARMAFGFGYESGGGGAEVDILGPTYRSRVLINGARTLGYWTLFEMGTIKIPPGRIEAGSSFDNFAITIDAERVSGTGSLYMDCLILIPRDDGFAHLRLPSAGDVENGDHMILNQYADGEIIGTSDADGLPWSPVTHSTNNWGMQVSVRPYVILAAQTYYGGAVDTFSCVKGEDANLTYTYIPRWRTLRGSAS